VNVTIGMPILDNVDGHTVNSLIGLIGSNGQHPITFIPSIGTTVIHDARNHVIKESYKGDFDALLFIDSDMEFPPDTLQRLIDRDKDIVGVLYGNKVTGKPNTFVYDQYTDKFKKINVKPQQGLVEVGAVGTGIMLIKKYVLDRVRCPWFYYEAGVGEDVNFCKVATLAGFKVYVDTDINIGHIGKRIWRLQ